MGDFLVHEPDNTGVQTLDELIRRRASDDVQTPILAYPRSPQSVDEFEFLSGNDVDRFVGNAAITLTKLGLETTRRAPSPVVGLYGPGASTLDYLVTFLALVRLGYAGLMLSSRLEATACSSLLDQLDANTLLTTHRGLETADSVRVARPATKILHIVGREQYDLPKSELDLQLAREELDIQTDPERVFGYIHSSGSKGLPKPLSYTHRRLMHNLQHARTETYFITVPMFHAFGMVNIFHCFLRRNLCYLFSSTVAQTHRTLTRALEAAQNPQYIVTVPYALKLWAEGQDGINALKAANLVVAAGSRIVDEVGNLLTENGVRLGVHYGATELGHVLSSTGRPVDDKSWDYLAASPHNIPSLYWRPYAENLYELIALDGYGGKDVSNSDDPPNSFHTSDLFEPHPTLQNRWKYIGRIDDRVTLSTGEKVLPLEIEGRIRQDPLVGEAVVFGVDRPVPGLLVSKVENAQQIPDLEFIERIWPTIQYANSRAEAFSQITKEMITILPEGWEFPMTDKMSVKRARVYQECASLIENVYTSVEDTSGSKLQLHSVEDIEHWIMETFDTSLGVKLKPETDFFSAGVDSLKAIQMRGLIVRTIELGGAENIKRCGAMMVFDCGNATRLARFLHALRNNEEVEPNEELEEMKALVQELSHFDTHIPIGAVEPETNTILLTGVTGSLGIHLLHALVNVTHVSRVFCMLRASSAEAASARIQDSLQQYGLKIDPSLMRKIEAVPSDHSTGEVDLPIEVVQELRSKLTHIIHAAWPVNFSLPLSSFHMHLRTLQGLVNLAQSVTLPHPAHVLFCSSVGTANGAPPATSIREAPVPQWTWANPTGYARSKLVGEKILQAAVESAGARATILRIGQIVPSADSSGSKLWNPNEMVPLMVRSANVVRALPKDLKGGDVCAWFPVDNLAKVIVDLGEMEGSVEQTYRAGEQQIVYNLVHPIQFSWKADFLPALSSAGLKFEEISWMEWITRLEASDSDLKKNPTRKLLNFWQRATGKDMESKVNGEQTNTVDLRGIGVTFQTNMAKRDSQAMKDAVGVVGTCIEDGYVFGLLQAWPTHGEIVRDKECLRLVGNHIVEGRSADIVKNLEIVKELAEQYPIDALSAAQRLGDVLRDEAFQSVFDVMKSYVEEQNGAETVMAAQDRLDACTLKVDRWKELCGYVWPGNGPFEDVRYDKSERELGGRRMSSGNERVSAERGEEGQEEVLNAEEHGSEVAVSPIQRASLTWAKSLQWKQRLRLRRREKELRLVAHEAER
ncbi:MAG: hypothetical protein Q9227_009230 [Pyrenula ochraceoflavens]